MPGYKIAILILGFTMLRGCDSKIVVEKVPSNTTVPANGVIYALPNTVARLQIKVEKATTSGARYSPFSGIFAPDGDPVCKYETISKDEYKKCIEGEDSFSLKQDTTFTTYGEPDPDNVFLVKFVGKGAIDQSLSMTWNEAGLLSAASSTVTNRTGDVILSGLKLVTGLGAKVALGSPGEVKGIDLKKPCGPDSITQDEWIVTTIVNGGLNSASALIANYCAIKNENRKKFPDDKTTVAVEFTDTHGQIIGTKTFEELLQDALLAYGEIDKLIAARDSILKGTSKSFEPASLLSHIEAEISQKLTTLYIGTKKSVTWDGSLDVRDLRGNNALVVMRLDPKKGFCLGQSELSRDSRPIPDKFKLSDDQCGAATAINLALNYYPDSSKQLFTRIADITTGERSFRYRIPAQVKAEVCDDTRHVGGKTVCDETKKLYGSGVFSVGQLGTIISLPATRHSKMLLYDLAFIESTGGLKTFKLGTTGGLDAGTVDALSGIGGALIDARNQARKDAEEVNRLTRQQQLLKLQDDICTIQKKYGLPCTVQPQ